MSDVRQTVMMSQKTHMRSKEMWTGPQKCIEKNFYTVVEKDNKLKFHKSKLSYTPALYKTIDEIIVNAIDHVTNYPGQVTYVKINYDIQSGIVQVINDGPGIPVYRVEIKRDNQGEPTVRHLNEDDQLSTDPTVIMKWFPQWISEEPLTGNNLEKRKTHITGGVNGAGMKLTNFLSEFFIIETVDGIRKKHYRQVMKKGSSIIEKPEITNIGVGSNAKVQSYTSITFRPDYVFLDYKNPSTIDYQVIEKLIKTRAYQIASYTNVNIFYQGEIIKIKNVLDLGEMFAPELKMMNISQVNDDVEMDLSKFELKLDSAPSKKKPLEITKRTYVYSTKLQSEKALDDKGNPLIWNVCVGPSMSECFDHMSVVNGMYIVDGGSHIDYLINQVIEYFEIELKKIT